jgi:glycosyltransferase involved in cell wall biosynthesis
MKKNILIFSNLFPNSERVHRGRFTAQLSLELNKEVNLKVVSPLPYMPKTNLLKNYELYFSYSKVPKEWQWNNIDVFYPKYLHIPKITVPIQAASIALFSKSILKRLYTKYHIDLINVHFAYPDGFAAVLIGKKIGIPVVTTVLGSDINNQYKYKIQKSILYWTLKNSDIITTVSNSLREKVICLGIKEEKVITTPNGINKSLFYPRNKINIREKLQLKNNIKYLIYVGFFNKVKGIKYLLNSILLLKKMDRLKFHTLIVGNGPLNTFVRSFIDSNSLNDNISLLGIKPHDEVPLWISASDLLCLPSLNEGHPNIILESLSCGVPVIASKVGGIPEIINKYNGILVPPANSRILAESISLAINRKWDQEQIIKNSKILSWKEAAENYINIFSKLISS